jgi:small conductance mechanosensitive channel
MAEGDRRGRRVGRAPRGRTPPPRRETATRRARQAAWRRGGGRTRVGAYQGAARTALSRFRRGTILAVAITAWLLMLLGVAPDEIEAGATPAAAVAQQPPAADPEPAAQQPADPPAAPTQPADPAEELGAAVDDATTTLRELGLTVTALLPRLLVALGLLLLAGLISAVLRPALRRVLRSWERADAMTALVGIGIWLLAISAALSVMVGDPRTLLGSVGLIGLALSWALQTPIESFTGWLLNSFRGYYRIGDRVAVGDVFGDVYRMDVLTTTLWEAGGPENRVRGEQPTGALITFPNAEILRSNVYNYTREFPFVWDEVTMQLADDSDLDYAADVIGRVAREILGPEMRERAAQYRAIAARSRVTIEIAEEPVLFFRPNESWVDISIRFIVDPRRRRRLVSDLTLALFREMNRDEHRGKIRAGHPHMVIERPREI